MSTEFFLAPDTAVQCFSQTITFNPYNAPTKWGPSERIIAFQSHATCNWQGKDSIPIWRTRNLKPKFLTPCYSNPKPQTIVSTQWAGPIGPIIGTKSHTFLAVVQQKRWTET